LSLECVFICGFVFGVFVLQVRPKLVRSKHYSAETGKYTTNSYRDATSIEVDKLPTSSMYPQQDDEGAVISPLLARASPC
jgi:hypothetical protein